MQSKNGKGIGSKSAPQDGGPLQEEMRKEWYGWVDGEIVNRQENQVSSI